MTWAVTLACMLGGLMALMACGVPVAFAFLTINIAGALLFMGGVQGLELLVLSIYDSLATFVFAPVPLFVLMGCIMFHSGIATRVLGALELCLGRLPGRLSLLAIGSGTVFASLTGSSMANTAMLGSTLVPEMHRRGYSKSMCTGPILAAGTLAVLIPPSALGVLLGSLAGISISSILIGGVVPGLLLASLYALYVVASAMLRPETAPAYESERVSAGTKLWAVLKNVAPLGLIVFLVIGVILLGWATPTESAALGAAATAFLAATLGDLTFDRLKTALIETAEITVMVFWIIGGAAAFSQILSFSGAGPGLVDWIANMEVPALGVVIIAMALFLFLGCFMEQLSMLMITIPILMPVIRSLEVDALWFGILTLITLEVAAISPPFGLGLFVMKGVAPAQITMTDIYRSAVPYLLCNLIVLALLIIFPQIALWLPGLQD